MFMRDKRAARRVARGAARLDTYHPGWFEKVNPSTLDLVSNGKCVLGQVYGDYGYGLGKINLNGPGLRYGFIMVSRPMYRAVTREWVRTIEARKQEAEAERRCQRAAQYIRDWETLRRLDFQPHENEEVSV